MAAVNVELTPLPTFDCTGDITCIGARWKRWKKAFEFYVVGKGVTQDSQKTALLLHSAGMGVQDVFETLPDIPFEATEDGERDSEYKAAIRKLDAYFLPKLNVAYERHVFRQLKQADDETMDQFVSRLKKQSFNCDFADVDEQIRDQVIDTCRSTQLRRKLLQRGTDLNLDNLLEISRALEAVELQLKNIESKSEVNHNEVKSEVNHSQVKGQTSRNRGSHGYRKPNMPKKTLAKPVCYRCGREGHIARDQRCPARSSTCNKCHLKGHFAAVCKTKTRTSKPETSDRRENPRGRKTLHYVDDQTEKNVDSDTDSNYSFLLTKANKLDSGLITVTLGGVETKMLIDSGSTANVVDQGTWRDMKRQRIKCISQKATERLYPYGAPKPLETIGKFWAEIKAGNQSVEAEFLVINGKGRSLLGKETAERLKVLRVGLNVNMVHTENQKSLMTAEDLYKSFPECFEGIGKLQDYQAKIHLDPNVKPVAQSPRRVPFGMRRKLEAKIDELLKSDIIEPVKGPTPWVSPVVIVPKSNDDIRLCIDMRQANAAVIRERHPMPTVDEILQKMNGSTVFSKLDLKNGFHQLELDEESRMITTFSCHLGLFRYKRLLFGISSAPELFQHVIHQAIAGCEGVENISDDMVVHGRDAAEHDRRLVKVLSRLKEVGLTLNFDKCLFGLQELEFVGHVFSSLGISPTRDRVKAVAEARRPETVSEVRSFMGLVNFSGRFIRNLATIAEPLRRLTRQGEPFSWGPEQEKSFKILREALVNSENLAYFRTEAVTRVIVDASPVGLGAILVQNHDGHERVICYASRSLSSVERRYSQTEKEALSIVWACERFHMFLCGIKFEIVTDHKPLMYIYSKKSKPSARIERWVLRLQPCDFTVRHIPGKDMSADALSRLINSAEREQTDTVEEYVRFIAKEATPRALQIREIEQASAEDKVLSKVRNCVKSGNLSDLPADYKCVRNELCVVGKVVLRGTRIVIPELMRKQVVSLAHEGHQGIVKVKARLRSKVWWPGMDREAERKCRACYGCQLLSQPSHPDPVKPTELPTQPWLDLAADLMGPLPSGEWIFAVVDYYSRFYEVEFLRTTTSDKLIRSLDRMFTTHGYPMSLKTDNGGNLISERFESYLRECGIEHRLTTPLWPQANGEIERQNRSMLKALKIAHAEGKDLRAELNKFLLAYRTTPHTTTGVSPAELMYGRPIRSKLPEMTERDVGRNLAVKDKDAEMKQKAKDYADTRRHVSESELVVGDCVLMEQQKQNKLTTKFAEKPFVIVDKTGSQVTVESNEGVRYKRNTSHVKKFLEDKVETTISQETGNGTGDDVVSLDDTGEETISTGDSNDVNVEETFKPVRQRKLPERFKDFHMYK